MQTRWYGAALRRFIEGTLDWQANTIRVALLNQNFVPNLGASDPLFSIAQGSQISGPGYTSGGRTLTNKLLGYSSTLLRTTLWADPAVWEDSTLTAHWALIYRDTGSALSSPLIAIAGDGSPVSSNLASLTVSWPNGVLQVSAVNS